MIALRLMLAVMLALSGVVSAQTTQPEVANPIRRSATSGPADRDAKNAGMDTTRVVVSLAAVIGLILLLRWGVRRMGVGRGASSRAVQVVARCPVSHKHQILVVQVGRKLLVVGESGQQLSALSEISDPDEVAAVLGQVGRGNDLSALVMASENAEPQADQEVPDEELSRARQQLNGLAEKVRGVARQLNRG
jgi:flagellar biogenesis protein FliO